MMNKISFLKWAVAALFLLNVATIVFFSTKKHPPRPEGPRKIIEERLHFDASQISDYDKLIVEHRRNITQKEQEIFLAKSALYSLLRDADFSKKDSLIGRIGQLQQEIEQVHFDHFQEIKSLCKGTQVADFEALTNDLVRYFGNRKDRKRKETERRK